MDAFRHFMYESTMAEAFASTPPRRAVAERLEGGLHGVRWRPPLGARDGAAVRLALLLEGGSLALRHAGGVLAAEAPAVLWSGWGPGHVLALSPGAKAAAVTLAEELLAEAVGVTHDTDHLRALLQAGAPVALGLDAGRQAALGQRLAAIEAELRGRGDGFHTALAAHLVLLAVELWRRLNAEGLTRPGAGGRHAVLERFRRLLELHFRERWSPGAYAAALGLAPRQLNRICSRHLGRPPRQLIDRRSLREARLRLERSGLTIAQIADELGFVDPPHFSRFFKAQTGLSPRAWRARAGAAGPDHAAPGAAAPAGFSDWP